MTDNIRLWTGFNFVVLCLLACDPGVFHRMAHGVTLKLVSRGVIVMARTGAVITSLLRPWQLATPGLPAE